MSRILLIAFGSSGSIQPCLAVGLGLQARGHQVSFAAGESHGTIFERHGLGFFPVRPDRTAVTANPEVSRQSTQLKSAFAVQNLLRYVEETYTDLLAACGGTDLFISHPALRTAGGGEASRPLAFTGPGAGHAVLDDGSASAALYAVAGEPSSNRELPALSDFSRLQEAHAEVDGACGRIASAGRAPADFESSFF